MVDRLFSATKALITNSQGEVLILKESSDYEEGTNEGKWDVPGGRVETGERFDKSLKREIREESGLRAEIGDSFFTDEWRPEVKGEKWQIIGTYFECFTESKDVELSRDHEKFSWIKPENYTEFNLIGGLEKVFEKYLGKRKQVKAAGKAVIIDEDGKVLLMKRSETETHLQNLWDVPGGSLNHGEKPDNALKRETMEEANIEIEVIEPIKTWTYMHDNGTHRFGATYLCKPLSEGIKLSDEHTDYRWVEIDEIDDMPMYDDLKEGVKLAQTKTD